MLKYLLVFGLLSIIVVDSTLFAQTGKIAGEVRDAATGESLNGANILIQGIVAGGVTDAQGYYHILFSGWHEPAHGTSPAAILQYQLNFGRTGAGADGRL